MRHTCFMFHRNIQCFAFILLFRGILQQALFSHSLFSLTQIPHSKWVRIEFFCCHSVLAAYLFNQMTHIIICNMKIGSLWIAQGAFIRFRAESESETFQLDAILLLNSIPHCLLTYLIKPRATLYSIFLTAQNDNFPTVYTKQRTRTRPIYLLYEDKEFFFTPHSNIKYVVDVKHCIEFWNRKKRTKQRWIRTNTHTHTQIQLTDCNLWYCYYIIIIFQFSHFT